MLILLRHRWLQYVLCTVFFFAIGFYFSLPSSKLPLIELIASPTAPADREFLITSSQRDDKGIESTANVKWTRERGPDNNLSVFYWCPAEAGVWGEVVVRWEWDESWTPEFAMLEPNLILAPLHDSSAAGELYLASEDTRGQWIELASLDARVSKDKGVTEPIDVTRWLKTSRYLQIKYRLKANRQLFHPTPDDPIGIAGAQCLRQLAGQQFASRLRLWRIQPTQ